MKKPELVNEDSSNRKRSSSLTEQGSRRREQLSQRLENMKPAVDEDLLTFHTELTETCIDLMARHTFSSCSALPRRYIYN
jgi:tuberous sclerosis protein 2